MKEVKTMKLYNTLIALTITLFILAAVRTDAQSSLNENSIKFENTTTATLVGQDGLIMRTEDGGMNWTVQESNITNVLNSIDYVSYIDANGEVQNLQMAVGENGLIMKSLDNGTSWEVMNSGTTENLNDVSIFSANKILVCGNNGTLLSSEDYGSTWASITLPTVKNLNHIASIGTTVMEAVNSVILVGDSGTIYTSVNLTDWTPVTVETAENLLATDYIGSDIIITGENGTILKSNDRGATWTMPVSGITTNLFDVKYITSTVVIASSENGVLVRSEDSGDNWITITTPTEADMYAVNFADASFGISIGSEGTEIYSTDGGQTWVTTLTGSKPAANSTDNIKLSQNYPNPFNPATIISYDVTSSANVSIKVYDMTGREVRTLVNSFQNAGTHTVEFNASNLASGIYFYVLRVNTGALELTKTMKMILTK